MSLMRQLLNEFRPFFRMFDDAAFQPFVVTPHHRRHQARHDPFEAFFGGFGTSFNRTANVELVEEGDQYVVKAELPGVKKENLDVFIGDSGRSLTIEGKILSSDKSSAESQSDDDDAARTTSSNAVQSRKADDNAQVRLTSERGAVLSQPGSSDQHWVSRSSFSRTIWLPRPVDAAKVSGTLEDGVLQVKIPMLAEEKERQRVTVE